MPSKSKATRETATRLDNANGKRTPYLPGLRLTPRDAAILMAVYQHRALTTPQIQRLFFADNGRNVQPTKPNTRCQYRLLVLYQHGYLLRDEQPQKLTEGRKPYVYWLAERGAGFVRELLDGEELDWHQGEHAVGHLFLEHLLATNEVRVALTLAARKHNFSIAAWLDDRTLKRQHMTDTVTLRGPNGGAQRAAVVPDGYFMLDTGDHLYHHFLEVDLATVTGTSQQGNRRTWGRKVAAYLEYYRSGKYQARYETQGLRVLMVTRGEKRLANLKRVTEEAGGRARFWFTTFERIENVDVLVDPIWEKAGESGLHTLVW